MRAEFAHEQAQAYLRQRNRFATLAGVLGLTSVVSLGAAVTRDEQFVLVPITAERLSLSAEGRSLAIEVWREGRASLRLFDLSGLALLWWVPLPHVGGMPRQLFSFSIPINSRSCTAGRGAFPAATT